MAKPWAKRLYNSAAWRKCRESYIASAFGLCESKGCGKPGYIVDHIVELTPENINDPNITLNHENLQYLCLVCHNVKTFQKYSPTAEGVMFDAEGNLIEVSAEEMSKQVGKKWW